MKTFAYAASVALLSATAAFAQSGNSVANGQTQPTLSQLIDSGGKANRIAPVDAATRAELQGITQNSVANPQAGLGPFNSGGRANRIAPTDAATSAELQGVTLTAAPDRQTGLEPFNSGGRANRIAPTDAATSAEVQGVSG